MKRPTDVPDMGLLCDLLWSDPDKDINGLGRERRACRSRSEKILLPLSS